MLRLFITLSALVALSAVPAMAQDTSNSEQGANTTAAQPDAADTAEDPKAELLFWESIKDSDNPDLFVAYITQFPDGLFRIVAEEKLKEIYASQGEGSEDDTATNAPVVQPAPAIAPKPQTTGASPRRIKIGLQRQLRRVGCYRGAIDGIWGPQSVRALIRYNRAMGTSFRPRFPNQKAWNAVLNTRQRVCW